MRHPGGIASLSRALSAHALTDSALHSQNMVAGTWNKNPFTGNTNSYGWWIVCFQLFAIVYAAYAVRAAAPCPAAS